MFKQQQQAPPQPPQSRELPPLVKYQVKTANGSWVDVECHNIELHEGSLVLIRGGYADENCTMQRVSPIHIFAPGEWKESKTDWTGYKKSEFSF